MAIERAIFDLDLTLYRQKDPDHHTHEDFYDTMLGRLVSRQIVAFVAEQEAVDPVKAAALFEESKADETGPSAFFGERYGLTRLEYFTATWGEIDAGEIVDEEDAETAQELFTFLKAEGIEPVLLTAGPQPWARKVLARLGLEAVFEDITFGEQFGHKREVFPRFLEDKTPEVQISVGDDLKADIEPARALGMHVLHIVETVSVRDLPRIIERVKDAE